MKDEEVLLGVEQADPATVPFPRHLRHTETREASFDEQGTTRKVG